ncbi:MAG: transcription antitermination factor NusB [Rhodobiaceae bacterium]|nr:transcription antitermination factor NusB [Rhodobiaceae bacterium]
MTTKTKGPDKRRGKALAGRSAARLAAVQALYQMDIAGTGIDSVLDEYETYRLGQEIDGEQYAPADAAHFRAVVSGVVTDQVAIDRTVNAILADNWPLARIDSILRALLRAATFELKGLPDIPSRVVINEYLDIAGAFFDAEEKSLANGVLDRAARQIRAGDATLAPDRETGD